MRVITFYTSQYYQFQAEEMAASARRVGLGVRLYARPDLGSWWQNCNQKCEVVKQALAEAKGEAVIFSDADTRYLSYPALLRGLDADFAAYFFSPGVPSGGTIWFNGRRAWPLVDAWRAAVRAHPEREDDSINFKSAIEKSRPIIFQLPPAYNWAEKSMRHNFPGTVPVIEHLFVGKHDYPVE